MAKRKKIKILVTAGPTWIKIDKVRILTNIFTGKTGLAIANYFKHKGFEVKLLLGSDIVVPDTLDTVRFRYFYQLQQLLKKELKDKSCKVVIHSAAVSDFKPYTPYKGKLSSSKKSLCLRLKPTPKIIRKIRKQREDVFLIQFKLEVNKSRKALLAQALSSMQKNKSNLVVANDLKDIQGRSYKAYIIDRQKRIQVVKSKKKLPKMLLSVITQNLLLKKMR